MDWSFPAATYLQSEKNSCLQTAGVEHVNIIESNHHDYCKSPKPPNKTLDTQDTPSGKCLEFHCLK